MTRPLYNHADSRQQSREGRNMTARIPCALPKRHTVRLSPDEAWPLRRADGRTWAEAAATRPKRTDLYQDRREYEKPTSWRVVIAATVVVFGIVALLVRAG